VQLLQLLPRDEEIVSEWHIELCRPRERGEWAMVMERWREPEMGAPDSGILSQSEFGGIHLRQPQEEALGDFLVRVRETERDRGEDEPSLSAPVCIQ
jgi:hypothetical protein